MTSQASGVKRQSHSPGIQGAARVLPIGVHVQTTPSARLAICRLMGNCLGPADALPSLQKYPAALSTIMCCARASCSRVRRPGFRRGFGQRSPPDGSQYPHHTATRRCAHDCSNRTHERQHRRQHGMGNAGTREFSGAVSTTTRGTTRPVFRPHRCRVVDARASCSCVGRPGFSRG